MPDWSIKIEGKPATFTPDIDGTPTGTPAESRAGGAEGRDCRSNAVQASRGNTVREIFPG